MSQTHEDPDHGSTDGTPRWVKVFWIIGIALVLLFVVLHLTGKGFGPGMHTQPAGAGDASFSDPGGARQP